MFFSFIASAWRFIDGAACADYPQYIVQGAIVKIPHSTYCSIVIYFQQRERAFSPERVRYFLFLHYRVIARLFVVSLFELQNVFI